MCWSSHYTTVRAGPNQERQYSVTQPDPPNAGPKNADTPPFFYDSNRAGLADWILFKRSCTEPARTDVFQYSNGTGQATFPTTRSYCADWDYELWAGLADWTLFKHSCIEPARTLFLVNYRKRNGTSTARFAPSIMTAFLTTTR